MKSRYNQNRSILNYLVSNETEGSPMLTASQIGTAARRFQAAYAVVMAPLSRELDMAPSALDILLYLANNPGRDTARDICAYRHLKPGIVSLHVERLVAEGYLTRSPVPGDRRKCRLLCTEKAWPVIRRGRQYQADFTARLTEGLAPADLATCQRCLAVLDANLAALAQGLPEKENDT